MRAGAMAVTALLGTLLGRPRSTAVVLATAVLVLLVLDPWLVRSIGFQLSVSATCGLVALAGPLGERLGRVLPGPVAAAAGTTLAAQLAVSPVLLFHFHDVPLVTIAANVAAAPAVAPSLLLGLLAAGAGLVSESLGRLVAGLAQLPLRYLEIVADTLGRAPVPHVTSRGGVTVLLVGGALVAAITLAVRLRWHPPRAAVVGALTVLPLVVWTSAVGKGPPDGLTVRFFDVGQGDAALITSPAGASILVDGGPDDDQVATELAALGVKRLDVVVASHPHADHIVGLPAVLARIPTGLVVEPGCPDASSLAVVLDRAIVDEGMDVANPRAGDTLTVGDLHVDVLSPDRCWAGTESDTNNDALVLRIDPRRGRGPDRERTRGAGTRSAPRSRGRPRSPVLKVPHHGAATSVPAFFQAVGAEVAIVSVGQNEYGHPVGSTLEAITAAGSAIWRTDEHGTITVTFDGSVPRVVAAR